MRPPIQALRQNPMAIPVGLREEPRRPEGGRRAAARGAPPPRPPAGAENPGNKTNLKVAAGGYLMGVASMEVKVSSVPDY
jgi:hypothetical protein